MFKNASFFPLFRKLFQTSSFVWNSQFSTFFGGFLVIFSPICSFISLTFIYERDMLGELSSVNPDEERSGQRSPRHLPRENQEYPGKPQSQQSAARIEPAYLSRSYLKFVTTTSREWEIGQLALVNVNIFNPFLCFLAGQRGYKQCREQNVKDTTWRGT